MHGPYFIHIWSLNLPCGFAENFPTKTWCLLVKSKQIVFHQPTRHSWLYQVVLGIRTPLGSSQ